MSSSLLIRNKIKGGSFVVVISVSVFVLNWFHPTGFNYRFHLLLLIDEDSVNLKTRWTFEIVVVI